MTKSRRSPTRWMLGLLLLTLAACGSPPPPPILDSSGDPLPTHAIQRLGSLRFLPASTWTDVIQYSPDGRYLATAGIVGAGTVHPQVHIWERQTGRDVTPAALKGVEATGVSWGPSGNRFVTSHGLNKPLAGLKMWSVGNDRPTSITSKDQGYNTVVWSPTMELLATRTADDQVVVLRLNGMDEFRFPFTGGSPKTYDAAHVLDFSADGWRLAVVCDAGVEIHDVSRRTPVVKINSHADFITCLRFLPDGGSIVIATGEGSLVIPIGSPDPVVKAFGNKLVENVVVSNDGQWLVSSSFMTAGPATVWSLKTGDRLIELPSETQAGTAFAPDDTELAFCRRRISFLQVGSWNDLSAPDAHETGMVFGQLSNDRIWTGDLGSTVWEWNVADGTGNRMINRDSGTAVALSLIDDRALAVAGEIADIDIIDLKTKKVIEVLDGHEPATTALAYSPQHKRLISAGRDGCIRGWGYDSAEATYVQSFEFKFGDKVGRPELALSVDGELCICGDAYSGNLQLLRVADGNPLWKEPLNSKANGFTPLAFTPDSRSIAIVMPSRASTANSNTFSIQFLGRQNANSQFWLECQASKVTEIAISSDGTLAAIAVESGDFVYGIEIWSIAQRKRLTTLRGHYDRTTWLGFTPDGKRLISLSLDGTGLIWDLESALKYVN